MVPSKLRVGGRGHGRYKGCELVMSLVNSWNQRAGWLESGEWREVVENECKEAGRQSSESPREVCAMTQRLDFILFVVEF